jgi:biotin carboxyl carrier protein
MIFDVLMDGKKRRLEINTVGAEQSVQAKLDGVPMAVDAVLLSPGLLSVLVNGRSYRLLLDGRAGERAVLLSGRRHVYELEDPRVLRARSRHAAGADGPQSLRAPMPGRVVRVLVQVDDTVMAKQGIVVIEAMKMQNELQSPKAGRVAQISAEIGTTVQAGDVLAVIE